ncbi:hypothetical protein KCU81_g9740, partial [Aureobasidium melanogenum]|uniref:Uncharacterized protein n=1 Tax=Aureobasidium melanogenum (strain CBS 110374) TaxID=1043003 RepID=A0A074W475_AURM1
MQTPPYTPETKIDESLQNRSSKGSRRPRASSVISNVSSEDGAVFLGKAPPRALTPRPRQRRPEPIQDTEQSIVTSEEDTRPPSPIWLWLEDQWTRTQRDETEFLRQLVLFLFITLAFVTVRSYNATCPPQSPGVVIKGNVDDPAWSAVDHNPWPMMDRDASDSVLSPATTLAGDISSSDWSPVQSKPDIPLDTNIAASHSGSSAFAMWSFLPAALTNPLQPSKLKEGVKSLLYPVTIAGSVWSFAQRQFMSWSWSKTTSAFTPVREPDIHGWDVVIANQERRQHFLSELRNMEEVSSQVHIKLNSELFERSADLSDIESYEELQTHLTELKTHQFEIVRLLGIYHKASIFASSALDDYILAGRSSTSTKDLDSLRLTMLDTGSQLLIHLNTAQENISFVVRAVEGLPWKADKQRWWLARWTDRYRYRGIVAAFDGLEHLGVYVIAACTVSINLKCSKIQDKDWNLYMDEFGG